VFTKTSNFAPAALRRALTLFVIVAAGSLKAADERPFISYDEGVYSENPNLRPGKLDFLYRHRRDLDQYNGFVWTPIFKGGAGALDPTVGESTHYGGGFVRPLAPWPDKGDLILGAQSVETPLDPIYEVQGEYRFPFGLGVGGGVVETLNPFSDVRFGKMTYRNKWRGWNYILEVQGQDTADRTEPGGYVALFNNYFMAVGGSDGEQWRVTGAVMAPETWKVVRPVLEVLWVDNSIGQIVGPKVLFANATLKYEGGFLSHPARLGRAMGPQGLEFGNPLGFLNPTFNRRLEVWEMGSLADFRADRIELPTGAIQERYEGYVFPFQLQEARSFLDAAFVGGAWSKSPVKDTPSIIGGIFAQFGFVKLSVGVEHQVEPRETMVTVGVVDRF
jgi:hypothetical protein